MQSFGRGWNLAPTTANQPTFKVSSTFLKVVESKGKAFGRSAHGAKFFSVTKAQEGRRNSPGDCFGVGNPRRGFPGACQRAVNRGFYLVLKTAVSSRHRLFGLLFSFRSGIFIWLKTEEVFQWRDFLFWRFFFSAPLSSFWFCFSCVCAGIFPQSGAIKPPPEVCRKKPC